MFRTFSLMHKQASTEIIKKFGCNKLLIAYQVKQVSEVDHTQRMSSQNLPFCVFCNLKS